MANLTPCQTPGAQFHAHISDKQVECVVDLPEPLQLTKAQAKILETNIHNAMELVLARYFVQTVEKTDRIG